MRPKKPRYHCGCKDLATCTHGGILLVDNLYPDNKGRPGYYRYKAPNGKFVGFTAESIEKANEVVLAAAAAYEPGTTRTKIVPLRDQLAFHVPKYITYMEKINPDLKTKSEWRNSCYQFHQFAREFIKLQNVAHEGIHTWWDALTYHQQKQRQAPFRRWFNWLMREKLVPKLEFNPFTLSHDVPRLLRKMQPDKQIPPLTFEQCARIYHKAPELGYDVLQDAIVIDLYTTFRESDLCKLRLLEHVTKDKLRVVIGKSESQRGETRAARYEWDLTEHPLLRAAINRCRERAIANYGCPFVLNHRPKRRVLSNKKGRRHAKVHVCQVLPERLYRMFIEVRDACGIEGAVFHGVRGLAHDLYRKAGYTEEAIQHLMAHEDVDTTKGYANPDELPYEAITMKIDLAL